MSFETSALAYLQANGNRPIDDSTTLTVDLPRTGPAPVLSGQVHGALIGQVLLSVNGGPQQVVHPLDYDEDPHAATTAGGLSACPSTAPTSWSGPTPSSGP